MMYYMIMALTETDIQKILFNNFTKQRRKRRYKIVVPNIYMYNWESDFLGLTPFGYFHEYEIKLNKSDFMQDFQKRDKHNWLRSLYVSPGEAVHYIPKNFYYVIHGFWLNANELPPYAGMIVVTESGQLKKVRPAPDLPAKKVTGEQMVKIATSLCYRFWALL